MDEEYKRITSTDEICDEGALNLVAGIINQARLDFMDSKPDSDIRKDAKRFFLSKEFEAMSGQDGPTVLKYLEKEYARRKSKKGRWRNGGQ